MLSPIETRRVFIGSLSLLLITVVMQLFFYFRGKRRTGDSKKRGAIFLAEFAKQVVRIAIAVMTVLYQTEVEKIFPFIGHAFHWTMDTLGVRVTQLVITAVIVASGVGAYYFKRLNQTWYGMVEVCVGALSALFVAGTLAPNQVDLAKCATLAGAAYVIARGLENRAKGKGLKQANV